MSSHRRQLQDRMLFPATGMNEIFGGRRPAILCGSCFLVQFQGDLRLSFLDVCTAASWAREETAQALHPN